jgi:deoxyribonuclease-4
MASASNKLLLGCFVPMSGPNYLIDTINMALECGANCFMFYTGSPQTTMRTQIKNMNVEQFHKLCIQNNITKNNIVVHAPYIINLATSDTQKQKFAKNFLQNEIDRVNQIGAKYLVVHPGNATNNISIDEAITNCANLINSLDCKDVILCIETMSGKGTEIGKTFLEVKDIINLIKNKKSIGVCLDTCHT